MELMKALLLLSVLLIMSCTFSTPRLKRLEDIPNNMTVETKIYLNAMGNIDQKIRFNGLITVIKKVINSPYFENQVKYRKFTDTTDSSNQVYVRIRKGVEQNSIFEDYTWNLNIKFQEQKDDKKEGILMMTLGWTYMDVIADEIYLNTLYLYRPNSEIAGTVCHEYMHRLGYMHDSDFSYESVPYVVGDICKSLYPIFNN